MSFVEIQEKHVRRAKLYGSFVLGWSIGIWTIPDASLANALHLEKGVFYPVNSLYFVAIVLIPIGYILWNWMQNNSIEERYTDET